MADGWNWQLLLPVATALATPILTAFLPRLWQDNLRQLQSESETRVKQLEALEKAMSVAATAKDTLGIDVNTHDLQNSFKHIMHEFAGPVVLSREALEEWSSRSFERRFATYPNFTMPIDLARRVRYLRRFTAISALCGFGFMVVSATGIGNKYISEFAHVLNIDPDEMMIFAFGYFFFLYCGAIFSRFRVLKQALRILRSMPESVTTERAAPISVEPPASEYLANNTLETSR